MRRKQRVTPQQGTNESTRVFIVDIKRLLTMCNDVSRQSFELVTPAPRVRGVTARRAMRGDAKCDNNHSLVGVYHMQNGGGLGAVSIHDCSGFYYYIFLSFANFQGNFYRFYLQVFSRKTCWWNITLLGKKSFYLEFLKIYFID